MKMFFSRATNLSKLALLCIPLSLFATKANATSIEAGFDIFHTPEFSSTINNVQINMPGGGTMNLGAMDVDLDGLPLSFWNPDVASLAGTDTIVARKEGVDFNTDPNATIDIELVALSLKSVNAIDLNQFAPNMGLGMADMYVLVGGEFEDMTADADNDGNPDGNGDGVCDAGETCTDLGLPSAGAQSSVGQMFNLTHENANGGTFDSFFDVFVDIIFTEVGNKDNIILTGTASDRLEGTNTEWTHDIPSTYPLNADVGDSIFLPHGDFHVGSIKHTGPHPYVVTVPEPSSLFLLSLGLLPLAYRRKRKA